VDGLSRDLGEEKSGMEPKFFKEGQLLALDEDDDVVPVEEGEAEDVELEGIKVAQ